MSDWKRIRVTQPLRVGEQFDIVDEQWTVVAIEEDRDAMWSFFYDDEGPAEASPGSHILVIEKVEP